MNAPLPSSPTSAHVLAEGKSLVADATSPCPLPSLARNDPDFWPTGGYWRGSVWLPTAYMTIKALDASGDYDLARRLARDLLRHMANTYRDFEPHTIWECYSPTETVPGTYAKRPGYSRPDFCGWSALGPISLFLEDVIGITQANAFDNRLECHFPAEPVGRIGVENYRFGDVVCDIVATKDAITVTTNRPFTLVADGRQIAMKAGQSQWARGGSHGSQTPTNPPCAPIPSSWQVLLPRPVFDENPEWITLYWRAWELAHAHVTDVPGLPAPRYMDCGHRSDRIWIWDTCFMALFCKYGPAEFPGIQSLENFYGIVLADDNAPLPKVLGNRWCEKDEGKMLDFMVHHVDNPPLFAWVEWLHALQTGDRQRLERVYLEKRWLQRWFDLFDSFDPAAPKPHGVSVSVALKRTADGYHWKGCPSGMDNTPRGRGPSAPSGTGAACPDNPDLLWVDALAQQGLAALCLSRIAALLGRDGEAADWHAKWAALRDKTNALYWDETDGFYYDILASDRSKVRVPTIASFWPLLAQMPTPAMTERLTQKLSDPETFG